MPGARLALGRIYMLRLLSAGREETGRLIDTHMEIAKYLEEKYKL